MSATRARLRVLSMNLRNGGAGVSELAGLIEVLAPDVIAAQELGPDLVLAVGILAAVVVRSTLAEEALLAQRLANYRTCCALTKRFIPFVL